MKGLLVAGLLAASLNVNATCNETSCNTDFMFGEKRIRLTYACRKTQDRGVWRCINPNQSFITVIEFEQYRKQYVRYEHDEGIRRICRTDGKMEWDCNFETGIDNSYFINRYGGMK